MLMRRLLTWTILGLGTAALAACNGAGSVGGEGGNSSSTGTGSDTTTSTGTGTVVQSKVDKIDLVLGIDNSRSMADKQEILSLALSDLVQALANPPCVDGTGAPAAMQPAGPTDPCPVAGTNREFDPVLDIHVGIVTSSLGGHGSDACPDTETFSCPGGGTNTTNNDMGHLVSRLDPCSAGSVPTYQGQGFLAWDPSGKLAPPGESNSATLTTNIKDLVLGAGQVGCGYESQMESWYRFLVDPDPYQTLTVGSNGQANPQGIDNTVLQQRADFLRPDSLLAILMLSDENDCSIKEYGQFYFAAQQRDPSNPNKNFFLPKARSECATNPNDTCCRSCGQDQSGCPADPGCSGSLDDKTDNVNLRCFDQKRRFGIDFLYPVDRYVNGLTSTTVPNRVGDLAPNPIFTNLNPTANPDASVRDAGLVVLSGIVGVPWQDLARDPTDLTKGYKNAEELAHASNGVTTWDMILGNPATYVAPLDPHMIESTTPRTGTDPITGDVLAPPSQAAGPGPDHINGHEYTPGTNMGVQTAPNDLEYACIFPLTTPRDCTDSSLGSCDCTDPQNDDPLCEQNGSSGRTLQVRAKAYPGLRQLNVLRDLGPQGVASSICPAQQTNPAGADYAYRPAVQALVARVKSRLKTP
jgi:hypothetical protein